MKKINETDLAMIINDRTMIDYIDRLKMLSVSLFTWKNLDDIAGTGASRFLEQSLYDNGRACFVKDDELGFMVLNVNPNDKLNIYICYQHVLMLGQSVIIKCMILMILFIL